MLTNVGAASCAREATSANTTMMIVCLRFSLTLEKMVFIFYLSFVKEYRVYTRIALYYITTGWKYQ